MPAVMGNGATANVDFVSAEEAVKLVRSGDHVFVGSGCAEPQSLVKALACCTSIDDAEILHILTLGVAPYADPRFPGRFRHNALFIGANVRDAVHQGNADYTPVFLHEIPALFRSGRIHVDVALLQVSPPDRSGYVSLGISVDVAKGAVDAASVVIAEVNPRMPRTHGDAFIHIGEIDAFVSTDTPVLELPQDPVDDVCRQIAGHVASLIPDEATIQMGIGEIPQALVPLLDHKHELGVHTEMLSEGIIELIEGGVVTNRKKPIHRGQVVTSFCMGTKRLYDYVNDNPHFGFYGVEHVNDPFVIAQHDRMVAINSALEVDLTGQVCADSLGTRFFSGIGGQVDFIRGAARSRGGRPIIAIRSTAKNGTVSRIVPVLSEGAGVVTTRGDVHYVVTEFGIASLHGRTVRERALALIAIAHPGFRSELLAAAKERRFIPAAHLPLPENARPYPEDTIGRDRLRDGREILFRPLRTDDERSLRDLFYSHSPETVHRRYGTAMRRLSPRQVEHFVTLDYDRRMAIGGFLASGPAEVDDDFDQLVAVARYDLDPATNFAECAFVVHDDLQNQGLGTVLLQRLMKVARSRHIDGFTALVNAGNARMMHLFARHASPLESTLEDGQYTVSFRFADVERERRRTAPPQR
jgi:acyl-CoA hydrolase/GNAT superfamily N-acetyltransferase